MLAFGEEQFIPVDWKFRGGKSPPAKQGCQAHLATCPTHNLPHSQCNWLFLFYYILFIAKQLPYLPLGEMLRQDGLRITVIFLCIHYFWSTHHMPGTGTLMLRTRTPRSLLCPVQIRSLEEQCTSQDFTGGRGSLCEWDIDKLEHIQGNRGWSISGPLSNHEVQNLKASRQGEFRVWRMSYSGLARTLSLHILLTTSLAS